MELITQSLRRHAANQASKPAVISGNSTFTYGQLWAYALATASWLASRGVKPRDRVVILVAPNDPWFAVAYFGAHLAGAAAIPLDLKGAETTTLAVQEQVAPAFLLAGAVLDELKTHLADGANTQDLAALEQRLPVVSPDETADILFTSGSTGQPKGVVLTHANIAAAAHNITTFIGNTGDDREVVTVPLNHSFGLGRLRCNILAGGTLIIVPGLTFPSLVFKALAAHQATGLACVPTGVAVLIKVGGERLGEFAATIRYMELGSARMEEAAKRAIMSLLPSTRICMHYGLTEASRSAFMEFHADESRLESVGRATPNVSISIADETGKPLGSGESGRIRIKAATVMKEYWRDPQRTAQVFDREGWFDTGDLGYLDAAGYLFLQGRVDDVINVGGKKVYPVTVEEAAMLYSGVVEAACVGKSDPDGLLGEVPVLYVVQQAGAGVDSAALLQFLAGRVELYAVPRFVRFVDAIPRTGSGKPQRVLLKARERAEP